MAKRTRRTYTREEKQKALDCLIRNGGNLSLTSRQLGIPRQTLRDWRDAEGLGSPELELRSTRLAIHRILLSLLRKGQFDRILQRGELKELAQVLQALHKLVCDWEKLEKALSLEREFRQQISALRARKT